MTILPCNEQSAVQIFLIELFAVPEYLNDSIITSHHSQDELIPPWGYGMVLDYCIDEIFQASLDGSFKHCFRVKADCVEATCRICPFPEYQ